MSAKKLVNRHSKILIIGSGPAGYTAAIYAARASLQPTIVAGLQPGGQLTITTEVENYPGFADIIQGPWLMEQMRLQAENVGTKIINDIIVKVDFTKKPFQAIGDSGDIFTADAMVIATGAQAQWLGLESEEKFKGFGVSACATCDGFFYRGKNVAVIGGGNTAVEEAIYLTNHANKVTIIHRRNKFRAEKILQDRLFDNPKIKVIWDSKLVDILGDNQPPSVTALKIENIKNGKIDKIDIDGVFIAIGHKPSTNIFKNKLDMDDNGYILVNAGTTKTSVDGIFAAGDVSDKIYRQAVTAASMGCMAALEAEKIYCI